MNTLLVEDNDYYREEIKAALKEKFHSMTVFEAANGTGALKKFKEYHPKIIFMDIALPGESGLSLTRKIKAIMVPVIIIMLTSYDYPEYRHAAKESGADYFLVKGTCSASDIQALVTSIIDDGDAPPA